MTQPTKSILLAEDDRFLRRACETKLKQAGFEVRVAVDGEEALAMARELHPGLKVVYITGHAAHLQKHGVEGALMFPKPFYPDELAERVLELLDA